MFEKFWKNREETLFFIGNIIVLLGLTLSLAWFLSFSLSLLNRALTVEAAKPAPAGGFQVEEFLKIKPLFEREGVGFNFPKPVTETGTTTESAAEAGTTTEAESITGTAT